MAGSKAPSAYNTKHKVIAALTWDDTKVQNYIIRVDVSEIWSRPKNALSHNFQEGTGSFNTNSR